MSTETVIVRGTAFYASVHKVNAYSGKYSIELAVDDATRDNLVKKGLKPARRQTGDLVKQEGMPEGTTIFKFSRKPMKTADVANPAPAVVDSDNKQSRVLIGNGSEVQIEVDLKDYDFKGKKGTSNDLVGIQILNLVPYTAVAKPARSSTSFTSTDGFKDTGAKGDDII